LATEPVIPEIKGECPAFKNGTIMVAGHRGVAIKAGEAGKQGPLVFYWHGTGSSSAESRTFAGTEEVIAMGGIVASFNGSQSSGAGMDCSGTGAHNTADFEAADQIVACAVKNHGIDPKRIYATGCSAGGLQSGCMGINRSGYMAAVATNSGGVTIGYGPFQDLTRVPAVMTMHGAPGADVVIVDFSQTSEAYDNYMMAKGAFVINCNHGGGHCGAPASLQTSAWQFMKDHPFGTHPSPYASGLPSGFHSSCKIATMTDRKPLGEGR
jgi:poly(3-hydroxybutyrate) depolymerase